MSEFVHPMRNEEEDIIGDLPKKKPYDWENDPDFANSLSGVGLVKVIELRKPRPFPAPIPRPHELPPVYDAHEEQTAA